MNSAALGLLGQLSALSDLQQAHGGADQHLTVDFCQFQTVLRSALDLQVNFTILAPGLERRGSLQPRRAPTRSTRLQSRSTPTSKIAGIHHVLRRIQLDIVHHNIFSYHSSSPSKGPRAHSWQLHTARALKW